MATTFNSTLTRLELSKMHVDQRSHSSGDAKARAKHRAAVAELAFSCPPNIADALNWLAAASQGVNHLTGASKRTTNYTKAVAGLRQIAGKFQSIALTLPDEALATVGTPKKVRSHCERIMRDVGGKTPTTEYCPTPAPESMRQYRRRDPFDNFIPLTPAARDLAEFATAVAKGIVPTGLNRLHTQKAIARGEWTVEQVQVASYAIRLGRNRARFLAERDRRQKSIQVIRNKQAAGKLAVEARKPVRKPRKRGSLIGLAETNFRPISTAETSPPETQE